MEKALALSSANVGGHMFKPSSHHTIFVHQNSAQVKNPAQTTCHILSSTSEAQYVTNFIAHYKVHVHVEEVHVAGTKIDYKLN